MDLLGFWQEQQGNGDESSSSSGSAISKVVGDGDGDGDEGADADDYLSVLVWNDGDSVFGYAMRVASKLLGKFGKAFYVMFFLVVHLMKLHSISLMWGVTSEAMEYEEQAELRAKRNNANAAMKNNEDGNGNNGEKKDDAKSKSKVGGKSRCVQLVPVQYCGWMDG